jgi:hypothetical protein
MLLVIAQNSLFGDEKKISLIKLVKEIVGTLKKGL